MYEVIKNVIESKRYELSDILTKIDTIWLQGSITDEQRAELVTLARNNANVQNSIDILAKLEELDKRVKALEEANADVPDEEQTEITYPEYASRTYYYNGDKVTFDEKVYVCTAPDGVPCVWSPSEYPAYWEEVTE